MFLGARSPAVNLSPTRGGCEKGKISPLESPFYTVASSQAERGKQNLRVILLGLLLPALLELSVHSLIHSLIYSSIYPFSI